MREHQILFKADMVRAVLDRRKTQTRRLVSPRTSEIGSLPIGEWHSLDFETPDPRLRVDRLGGGQYLHVPRRDGETVHRVYPRIEPGHRLWVRETWAAFDAPDESDRTVVAYRASTHGDQLVWSGGDGDIQIIEIGRWRPSIHMPRWASRITLEVTDVRVQRLQDITEEDAIAEGMHWRDAGPDKWGKNPKPAWSWQQPHPVDEDPERGWERCLGTARLALGNLWNRLAPVGARWGDNPWVWVTEFRRVDATGSQLGAEGVDRA